MWIHPSRYTSFEFQFVLFHTYPHLLHFVLFEFSNTVLYCKSWAKKGMGPNLLNLGERPPIPIRERSNIQQRNSRPLELVVVSARPKAFLIQCKTQRLTIKWRRYSKSEHHTEWHNGSFIERDFQRMQIRGSQSNIWWAHLVRSASQIFPAAQKSKKLATCRVEEVRKSRCRVDMKS